MGRRNFLARRVVLKMRWQGEVPRREALVEQAEKGLGALPEDADPDGVDVRDDLYECAALSVD